MSELTYAAQRRIAAIEAATCEPRYPAAQYVGFIIGSWCVGFILIAAAMEIGVYMQGAPAGAFFGSLADITHKIF